jgi:hypothetical protein
LILIKKIKIKKNNFNCEIKTKSISAGLISSKNGKDANPFNAG